MYTPNGVYWELPLSKHIIQSLSNCKTPTGLLRQGTSQNLHRKTKGPMKDSQALAQPASPTQERTERGIIQSKEWQLLLRNNRILLKQVIKKTLILRDLHQSMIGPEVRDTVQGIISVQGIILHPLYLTPASGVSLKLV